MPQLYASVSFMVSWWYAICLCDHAVLIVHLRTRCLSPSLHDCDASPSVRSCETQTQPIFNVLSRRGKQLWMAIELKHAIITGMTIIMFAVSTVHIGLSIEGFYENYLKTPKWSSGVGTDPSCITKLYLPAINVSAVAPLVCVSDSNHIAVHVVRCHRHVAGLRIVGVQQEGMYRTLHPCPGNRR